MAALGYGPLDPTLDLITFECIDPQCGSPTNPIHDCTNSWFLAVRLEEFNSSSRAALLWQCRKSRYPIGFCMGGHLPFDQIRTILLFAELSSANKLDYTVNESTLTGRGQDCHVAAFSPSDEIRQECGSKRFASRLDHLESEPAPLRRTSAPERSCCREQLRIVSSMALFQQLWLAVGRKPPLDWHRRHRRIETLELVECQ